MSRVSLDQSYNHRGAKGCKLVKSFKYETIQEKFQTMSHLMSILDEGDSYIARNDEGRIEVERFHYIKNPIERLSNRKLDRADLQDIPALKVKHD